VRWRFWFSGSVVDVVLVVDVLAGTTVLGRGRRARRRAGASISFGTSAASA
jgi:hypothetical protein